MHTPQPTSQTETTAGLPQAPSDRSASCGPADAGCSDPSRRRLGIMGTLARGALGTWMVWSVAFGNWRGSFHLLPWVLGLLLFPTIVLLWHWNRVRQGRGPTAKAGLLAGGGHPALLAILYFLPDFVPALWFTTDTALIFYGSTMLLGAARGQRGCEVLALSNWVLRRNDSVGCLLFAPADALDRSAARGR